MTHFLPTTNSLAAHDDDHTIVVAPEDRTPARRMTTPSRCPADVVCGSRIRCRTCRVC